MPKIRFIFSFIVAGIFLFSSGTTKAMGNPIVIQGFEEPYFISHKGKETLAEGKLISYNGKSYISILDVSKLLGLTIDDSDENIYFSGDPVITLTGNANALPKESIETIHPLQVNPLINANAGFVIDNRNPGTPVFSKNAHKKLFPASTTKIMTMLLALENGNLNEVVTIGSSVSKIPFDSSKAGIKQGDQMTLEQLLYALILPSGNDAAVAVAEHIGGSEDQFVKMMNKRAKELGAMNTSYTNSHGYHHPNLYTTASDLALIVREASANQAYKKIAGTPVYTAYYKDKNGKTMTKTWKNTNKHIQAANPFYLDSIKAGKTGYTGEARYNLVTTAAIGSNNYTIVLLRGEKDHGYKDTINLVKAIKAKQPIKTETRTTLNIMPFTKNLYINGKENNKNSDMFIKDDQMYISTDLMKEFSSKISNVQVSTTATLKASFNQELLPLVQDQPIIQNNRMLVPIKSFFEKAGLTLHWDQKNKIIQASSSDTSIVMTIYSKSATVNGKNIELEVPPTILNGRTLVPLRFISESTGSMVDWGRGRTLVLN
ncbi:stalk domain-containing protein [Bacillus sp. S/N-304-OC-R1]|uniref:stalk domain-containing protein n=1 Tax=Bacillus sp. S/N-304-OC-R1 TaxID=2758034 RepID=UPI001C8EF294|nr:stalk domain-containing protein [Bacillus sp. S/N-304-OC-R1]MBY0121450.1 serine hydrolase [Bacillus sp. S/N-304-OC-R1]